MNAIDTNRLVLKIPVRPPFNRFTWKWMGLLSVLALGVMWTMLTTLQPEAHIPFSKFMEQLHAGNIEQVHITDEEIIGRFSIPVQWSASSNTSTAQQGAVYPANHYSNFRVVLPNRLSASSLDSLLAENEVTRSAASVPMPWFTALLRYTLPFALLIITAIWILRQFTFKAQMIPVRLRRK